MDQAMAADAWVHDDNDTFSHPDEDLEEFPVLPLGLVHLNLSHNCLPAIPSLGQQSLVGWGGGGVGGTRSRSSFCYM